uniref:Cytochrome c oxidase subunit 2 n=1 Tax=Bothromesostoma personatum TaxID=27905 RepID=A0A343VVJ2_9PLAT
MNNFFFNNILTLNFPHGSTPVMGNIINFHEKCLLIILFVLVVVLTLLLYNILFSLSQTNGLENTLLEILWTVIPTLIIITIMVPSLEILYFSEESGGSFFSNNLKVVGHQWYWTYDEFEISNQALLNFDSYLINESDLNLGEFRNNEVDRPVIFEVNRATRLLITSADVIHSWAVPEFGVKVDAVPGRLNQIVVFTSEPGRFFGYCSELCGVNHSFMPIVVEVINI